MKMIAGLVYQQLSHDIKTIKIVNSMCFRKYGVRNGYPVILNWLIDFFFDQILNFDDVQKLEYMYIINPYYNILFF